MSTTPLLLDDLSDAQRDAVIAESGPIAILAGAGSGKTRVLTRRIAYRVTTETASPRHIVAVTFTRKAAEELRGRLHELSGPTDVVAGTFHAIAYAQLRRWYGDQSKAMPGLISSRRSFITRNLSNNLNIEIDTAMPFIDWGLARGISPDEFHAQLVIRARTLLPREVPAVASLYSDYAKEKRKRGVLDFDDLLTETTRLFRIDEEFAHAQRWRFRHIFVDEVQDINPCQLDLLRAWLGDRNDLCVVGDPNQAIYGWNGADSSFLRDFDQQFENAQVFALRENYRSTPNVLRFAQAALEVATTTHIAVREESVDATVTPYANANEEIKGVIASLQSQRANGLLFTDIAILARTNAQLNAFARELQTRGLPVRLSATHFEAQKQLRDLSKTIARMGPNIPVAVAFTRWIESDEEHRELAPVAELDELVAEFTAIDPAGSARAFADWMTVATTNDRPREPGIDLLTFHKAKGLEWHTVYVVGLEDGYVPIASGDTDEERRLLYVALTRATDVLHCSYAKRRAFGAQETDREPSPFLMRTIAQPLQAEPESTWRDSLAAARAKLR